MFEHLTTRAELIEANIAAAMGKRADTIRKRYEGRRGEYMSIAFGFGYYLFSSIFLPLLTAVLIFLYLFLRYFLPVIYVLLCVSLLISIDYNFVASNMEWITNATPLLVVIRVVIPVILISAVFISLATAISILYRKAIFVDTDI